MVTLDEVKEPSKGKGGEVSEKYWESAKIMFAKSWKLPGMSQIRFMVTKSAAGFLFIESLLEVVSK